MYFLCTGNLQQHGNLTALYFHAFKILVQKTSRIQELFFRHYIGFFLSKFHYKSNDTFSCLKMSQPTTYYINISVYNILVYCSLGSTTFHIKYSNEVFFPLNWVTSCVLRR